MRHSHYVFVGIAGESLSNRTTSRLGTGLFRSPVDRLGEWEDLSPQLAELPEVRAIASAADDPDTVYVGTQCGVHRSRDGGDTWELLGAPRPEFGVWSLAVPPAAPDVVLAGYEPNAVYASTDRGRTWTAAVMPAGYPAGASHEPKRVIGLACDPADPRRVYAAVEAGGALYSDDGGRSFTAAVLSADVDLLDLHAVGVARAGVLAVGRDGIFRSADHGRTFAHALDDSLQVDAVTRDELEDIVATLSRDRFDGNLCVRRVEVGDGIRFALGARRSSRDDYGESFDARAIGARRNGEGRAQPAACWHAVAAVIEACYRRRDNLVVSTGLARFDDVAGFRACAGPALEHCDCNQPGGADREPQIRAALGWSMVEQYCRSIAVASADLVYVGAGASWLSEHGTIYASRDGGASFRPIELPRGVRSTVFGIAAAPADSRRIAAATKQGQVLLSSDAGASWQIANLPVEAHPVYALTVT